MRLPVRIPNGAEIPVKGVGTTRLSNGIEIKSVLSVPNFKCNLLSVRKLTQDLNCSLTFFSDHCIMQDLHSRKLIGLGKVIDGLYCMEATRQTGVALSVSVESKIWHMRLGHASNSVLRKIEHLASFNNQSFCDSCIKAKQTRLPFPTSFIKTNSCFELIHCDI